jgi:cobalt-zinc-cadmium efflux system membrane fusion protein
LNRDDLRFVVALFSLLATACNKSEAPPAPPAPAPTSHVIALSDEGVKNAQIRSQPVSRESFAPKLSAVATLEPDPQHVARVGARAAGRVVSLDVRVGDRVKQGQELMQIETAEMHQVSLEYRTAMARAREANDVLERQRQLVKERVGAVQDLRRAEANAESANAALREGEEHLRFLGLSAQAVASIRSGSGNAGEHSVVRAPIAGRIASLSASIGQGLTGSEDVVTIVDSEELWATLRIYERDLGSVKVGTAVELRVPSYPDRTFNASIQTVSETVDPVTHTAFARAKLLNADSALKSGMTATASVALEPSESSLWLPAEAVQAHGAERIVFVRVGEGRFEPREVTAGVERSGFVPVTAGLNPGDDVVVQGAFALRSELDRAEVQGD